jgi:hypothetical protein
MPFRPTPCRCAGYQAPRFDPRITVGPGPHPKPPTDQQYHSDVDQLLNNIENKNNLRDTKIGYTPVGQPAPIDDDAPPEVYEKPVLQNLALGYDA